MFWCNDENMDELPYQNCGSVIEIRKMEQRKSTDGNKLYFNIKRENILIYVDFSKLCHVITYFPKLNQIFGQEDITFPISSSSRSIECQNKHPIEL